MILEARPEDFLHLLLPAQEMGDHPRVLFMTRHAHGQGLGAAHDQERIERREDRALGVLHELQPLGVVGLSADRDPADAVGMAVQELGGGMHHDVRAEAQGPLEEGTHEGVVDHHPRALAARDGGESADVADLHHGIARRLHPQKGEVSRGLFESRGIGQVDKVESHAVRRYELGEEAMGAAVDVVAHDHALSGLHERQNRVAGGEAGSEADPVDSALKGGEVGFEGEAGGILGAPVFEALVFVDAFLHVGGGEVERCDDGAGGGVWMLTGVDAVGGETHGERDLFCKD